MTDEESENQYSKWEQIAYRDMDDSSYSLSRLPVPNGWIYLNRSRFRHGSDCHYSESQCFVPYSKEQKNE